MIRVDDDHNTALQLLGGPENCSWIVRCFLKSVQKNKCSTSSTLPSSSTSSCPSFVFSSSSPPFTSPSSFPLAPSCFFPPPTSCPPDPSSSHASVLFLFLFQVFLLLHPPLFLLILFFSYSSSPLSLIVRLVSHTPIFVTQSRSVQKEFSK